MLIALVFLTIVGALAILVWLVVRAETNPPPAIAWTGPSRDRDDVTPAEAQRSGIPLPGAVIWSRDFGPGGWVCAAPAAGMPGQICGWPAGPEGCPEHGELLIPDADETADTTHPDYPAGSAR